MSTTACVALLALLLFWAVGAHNRLVRLNHVVAACHEPIDAQLRLRQQVLKQLLQMSRSFESAAALTASLAAMQVAIDALAQRPSAAALVSPGGSLKVGARVELFGLKVTGALLRLWRFHFIYFF
jgi:LemA protein